MHVGLAVKVVVLMFVTWVSLKTQRVSLMDVLKSNLFLLNLHLTLHLPQLLLKLHIFDHGLVQWLVHGVCEVSYLIDGSGVSIIGCIMHILMMACELDILVKILIR